MPVVPDSNSAETVEAAEATETAKAVIAFVTARPVITFAAARPMDEVRSGGSVADVGAPCPLPPHSASRPVCRTPHPVRHTPHTARRRPAEVDSSVSRERRT
ncbi:hypothetical protein [Streptomyces kasugaensis]|uniref:hypothetical protein n=1 Tax=Streptomyces kasugaensis TaxID=1946 RepID=UPI000B9E1FF2|nr:hypothetical protein [Streptomyces kasugaensis]